MEVSVHLTGNLGMMTKMVKIHMRYEEKANRADNSIVAMKNKFEEQV